MNIFIYRVVMKMVNMDFVFDFMFINLKNDSGVSNVRMLCKMMCIFFM